MISGCRPVLLCGLLLLTCALSAVQEQHHSRVLPLEFLVGFDSYEPHRLLVRRLRTLLGTDDGWTFVARDNPAMKFPTDFVLIRFAGSGESSRLLPRLRGAPGVKYVSAHRQVSRSLLYVPDQQDEGAHAVDADAEGEVACDAHDVGCFPPPSPFKSRGILNVAEKRLPILQHQRHLLSRAHSVTSQLGAPTLWKKGFFGKGVHVAVFDTGLKDGHPHFRHVRERTNWTNEKTLNDGLGHGTFVAGVIASQSQCLGFAPEAELHIFRVFTNKQVSYTAWFMDSFNYAIYSGVNLLNLSIGGPDFLDGPFVDKVHEMSANNIIVISAIGNDGPLYGTLNNPADQMDVIGVGGMTRAQTIARFSSRGMTTWELPAGYGRVKPDIITYGTEIRGSRIFGGCRALSGTSVASPVVAGAVTLLASTVPASRRWRVLNPAVVKQALVHTAKRIPNAHIFEQGMGRMDLIAAHRYLAAYTPRATVVPSVVDLTDAPYMWPYSSQPLYHTGRPTMVNLTVLNGMGLSGNVVEPTWVPKEGANQDLLHVEFTYPDLLWPWSGFFALHITVHRNVERAVIVEGKVKLRVTSRGLVSPIEVPVKVRVVPTPPRQKRVLWDQFHSLRYPSGYFPRDNLDVKVDVLDWNGDHIHTNFRDVYNHLVAEGYFVEVLGEDFTCFDASLYGTLLIVDPEEEYFPEEITKLQADIEQRGLSVVLLAEWYNTDLMRKIKFFDDNTNRWWTPVTGGSNVPALNQLLKPYGIAFGDEVYKGQFSLGGHSALYLSGTTLIRFPERGLVHKTALTEMSKLGVGRKNAAILGLFDVNEKLRKAHDQNGTGAFSGTAGRIAIYGDSNCLDMSHRSVPPCTWLLDALLKFSMASEVESMFPRSSILSKPLDTGDSLPTRLDAHRLMEFSRVASLTAHAGKCRGKHNHNVSSSLHPAERIAQFLPQRADQVSTDGSAGWLGQTTASSGLLVTLGVVATVVVLVFIVAMLRLRGSGDAGSGSSARSSPPVSPGGVQAISFPSDGSGPQFRLGALASPAAPVMPHQQ